MKAAIMGRSMRPPLTGIGRYTRNLVTHLAPLVSPESLTLFVTRESDILHAPGIRTVAAPLPTPHEAFRAAWEHSVVPYQALRTGLDVYHSPNYTLPLILGCASVVTVHDLAFLDPRFHNRRLQLYLRLLTKRSLKAATRVIAVSEYTKRQVEERYPFIAGKVSVVYSGLDPSFLPEEAPASSQSNGRRPYILFVGSVEPRKNLPRLIRAFERAVQGSGLPHELVLCGPWGWRYDNVIAALDRSPVRDRIRRVGYMPSNELRELYAHADLLAYPSLDEGFGFPILEAMSTGTPVVTADRGAPPEISGGAAVTVDPTSVSAITEALERVLTDRALATELAEKGRLRAGQFSWKRAAEQTLAVYQEAMEAHR